MILCHITFCNYVFVSITNCFHDDQRNENYFNSNYNCVAYGIS